MKKNWSLIVYLLMVAVLAGCTLYMDEPPEVPEAERGFGEPYTEKNDSMEVTYEYYDDVNAFPESVANDYVVKVEGDSVVYLSESTPDELVPRLGEKIIIDPCNATKYGLMGVATSVNNVGGVIRIELLPAEIDDVFKTLKMEFNGTVNMLNATSPDDSLEMNNPDRLRNWALDPEIQGFSDDELEWVDDEGNPIAEPAEARVWREREEAKARARARFTRADDDGHGTGHELDDYKTEQPWDKKPDMDFEFGFDTRRVAKFFGGMAESASEKFDLAEAKAENVSAIASFLDVELPETLEEIMDVAGKAKTIFDCAKPFLTGDMYLAGKVAYKNTLDVHALIDTDKDLVEFWVDQDSKFTYDMESGVKYKGKDYFTCGPWMDDPDVKPGAGFEVDKDFGAEEPIRIFPLWKCIWLTANPHGKLHFDCSAVGRVHYERMYKGRMGVRINNGKMEKVSEDRTPEGQRTVKRLDWGGQAEAYAMLGLGLGIQVGKKGVNFTIEFGGEMSVGARLECGTTLVETTNWKRQVLSESHNFFNPYVKFEPYIDAYINLTKLFKVKDRMHFDPITLAGSKFAIFPNLNTAATVVRVDQNYNNPVEGQTHAFYLASQFKVPGILVKTLGTTMPTFMRVYEKEGHKFKGDYYSGVMGMVPETVDKDANHIYNYHLTKLGPDNLYYAVPCISIGDIVYEFDKGSRYYFSATSPKVFLSEEERDIWKNYTNTGKTRTSAPLELVHVDPIAGLGSVGGDYYIGMNANLQGKAKCNSWGFDVTLHGGGVKDTKKTLTIKGNKSQYNGAYVRVLFRVKAKNRPEMKVTVRPWCNVVQYNNSNKKVYYDDEVESIDVNNMMDGSGDFSYDNGNQFDF